MKRIPVILSFLLIFMVFSCTLEPESKGSLTLHLTDLVTTKTLVPDADMAIAGYQIILEHEKGTVIEKSVTENKLTIDKIEFGKWDIKVNALNKSNACIGTGQSSAEVHTGTTTNVNVVVRPLAGMGDLAISLIWSSDAVDTPSISAELIPPEGSEFVLPFQITESGKAAHSSIGIPTGYYTLVLKLLDNNQLVMGAVEVVRILKDQVTKGTFTFDKVNKPGGNLVVEITPDLQEPIPVTISGQKASIATRETLTLATSVPEGTGNVICVWYVNGNPQATGNSWTARNLEKGIYRIDATVFSADGSKGGSSSFMLEVLESPPLFTLTIEADKDGTVEPTGPQEIVLNQDIPISATPKWEWAHFTGWQVTSGEGVVIAEDWSSHTTVRLTKGSGTIKATFWNEGFNILYFTYMDNSDCYSHQVNYKEPTTTTLSATHYQGFDFSHWSCSENITIENSRDPQSKVIITGPGSITCYYTRQNPSLMLISSEGGSALITYEGIIYRSDYAEGTYDIIAEPDEGYRFKEWLVVSGEPEILDKTCPRSIVTIYSYINNNVVQAVFEPLIPLD